MDLGEAGGAAGIGDLVAARGPGVEKGGIGALNAGGKLLAGIDRGDAQAHREGELATADRPWLGAHRSADLLRRAHSAVERGARQEGQQLFPSPAGDQVLRAHGALEQPGDVDERLLRHLLAVGRVDVAEPVELGHGEREARPSPAHALGLAFEQLEDGLPVEEAGQGVGALHRGEGSLPGGYSKHA